MAEGRELLIGGVKISPGESRQISLFVSKQYDFTELFMPVKVIRGREEGPRLFVSSAIHGDEVNGVEIIKRLLKHRGLHHLKGTLICAPIVNVFGFNSLSRYLPDRRDLNRCFPGSRKGSLASRLARLFVTEILDKCTHGIDLHTGSLHRINLPQIRACLKVRGTRRLANEFDVPVILDADIIDGTLRKVAYERNMPLLVFEGGEPLRYNEIAIRSGVAGILSVMRALGMIEKSGKKTRKVKSLIAKGTSWVRAPHGGILIIRKGLGSIVRKNELLGIVSDPLGNDNIEIRAKKKGIIIGHTQLPLVNRGDAVFNVATFERTKPLVQSMEQFDDRFDYEER
ncbi:MAG: succinylglutamate desuccinylase/aspartoacylase family protein [Nitrospiraceae bacterium]|nr:MAG: succinylglutamate desuccinylase/aspartoacylase family protein [Nitrospiraceae bacterium]